MVPMYSFPAAHHSAVNEGLLLAGELPKAARPLS
jgi:hypothetical protein